MTALADLAALAALVALAALAALAGDPLPWESSPKAGIRRQKISCVC